MFAKVKCIKKDCYEADISVRRTEIFISFYFLQTIIIIRTNSLVVEYLKFWLLRSRTRLVEPDEEENIKHCY